MTAEKHRQPITRGSEDSAGSWANTRWIRWRDGTDAGCWKQIICDLADNRIVQAESAEWWCQLVALCVYWAKSNQKWRGGIFLGVNLLNFLAAHLRCSLRGGRASRRICARDSGVRYKNANRSAASIPSGSKAKSFLIRVIQQSAMGFSVRSLCSLRLCGFLS